MPGHAIPLATFVRTAEQTEAVIRALSGVLFQGELRIELVVLPPEEGSFRARLGVWVAAGLAAVWAGIESDVGKGLIRGLTGEEPAHWSQLLGEKVRWIVEDLTDPDQRPVPDEEEFAARVVSEIATSFLSRDNDDLARAGIGQRQFREAFEAKNEFYRACVDAPQVRAIGFSEEADFPIQRSDFVRLQTVLPAKEDDDVDHPWFAETTTVKVTSPNWDRNDRGRRWKGRDQQGRDRLFLIEDEGFWQRASVDAIHTHVIDVIKVQWAFQGSSEHRRNLRVLRVIEFNGEPVSVALSDQELEAAVGWLRELADRQQSDLFD